MGSLVRFLVLLLVKILAAIFYRFDVRWLNPESERHFREIRICVLLNHTSLYEPLFLRIVPLRTLWQIASRSVYPAADKTMERPIVGRFFKLLGPKPVPISRKRDETWTSFKCAIDSRSLVILVPEGRMKRATGLDLQGRPMTVRGGVADVLEQMDHGRMLILYSGGLHHVQVPGQLFPKPFKRIRAGLESVSISSYKAICESQALGLSFRQAVINDLQQRLNTHCHAAQPVPEQSS